MRYNTLLFAILLSGCSGTNAARYKAGQVRMMDTLNQIERGRLKPSPDYEMLGALDSIGHWMHSISGVESTGPKFEAD